MRATSAAKQTHKQQTERKQQARTEVRRTSSNRQQSGKKRLRLWAVVMLVLFVWGGYIWVGQSTAIANKASQLEASEGVKAQSETKLSDVRAEIKRLQDPEYISEIARKEYNMYKPEEIPIKVTGEGGGE